jgi:creatinine amidohydrolase
MTETAWNRLPAETLRALAAKDAIVLLPVASTEQHGPHLATGVDDFLCSEVCRRVAAELTPEVPVLVTPTVWFGLADHHVPFGGTFTISLATYYAVLRDLCRSVLGVGFRRIVIVNGHGGNMQALAAFTGELTRELGASIATTTYFMEGAAEQAKILEDQNGVMHACEAETSMMMAIHPELVNRSRLEEAHGPNFDLTASLVPSLKAFRTFAELTASGVAGDARKASASKGEALLKACASALAARLRAGQPWSDTRR